MSSQTYLENKWKYAAYHIYALYLACDILINEGNWKIRAKQLVVSNIS